MNVELNPSTETLVRKLMLSGGFDNEEDAIADAVRARLTDDEAYWAELAASIEESRESIRAGRGTLLTPELGPQILREAHALRDARAVSFE